MTGVFGSEVQYDYITPLLRDLHWLSLQLSSEFQLFAWEFTLKILTFFQCRDFEQFNFGIEKSA